MDTSRSEPSANAHRVLIEVEDECGGLPPGKAEELFDAFQQRAKSEPVWAGGCSSAARASRQMMA
jgi:K+-sensing histidine kinase KdpD